MGKRRIVWMYGGGTQSAAIAALIVQGRLPRPHRVVMADTGREASVTWDYLRDVVQPALDTVGLRVEIVPQTYAKVDLYSSKGDLLLPAYTANGGKLPIFCSNEWKTRPCRRYLRETGEREITAWLGMSTDEVKRLKHTGLKWIKNDWPLCYAVPMRRGDCVEVVRVIGWPGPPKSACWMCPNRSDREWRAVRDDPRDWPRAIAFDKMIRAQDQQGGVFVHWSGKPLDEADLDGDAQQPTLWDDCTSGMCWT